MIGLLGAAISTTGDVHRMDLLTHSVRGWLQELPGGSPLVVTVDGSAEDAQRAASVVFNAVGIFAVVQRVGQRRWGVDPYNGRLGVAVNKNTGIEYLMDAGVDHLFLSDDDTWPLYAESLNKHIELSERDHIGHSMVSWGAHRLETVRSDPDGTAWATWTWPRGVMLYADQDSVNCVGGMVEKFGPGGHEHAEWSMRMHNALMTPDDFCSPASYATREGYGARALWHCEDMRRPGETLGHLRQRRRKLTSVRRQEGDWDRIHKVMDAQAGNSEYVSYRAIDNGRASATLCGSNPSRGAGEE